MQAMDAPLGTRFSGEKWKETEVSSTFKTQSVMENTQEGFLDMLPWPSGSRLAVSILISDPSVDLILFPNVTFQHLRMTKQCPKRSHQT
jgi:hypothetical protein